MAVFLPIIATSAWEATALVAVQYAAEIALTVGVSSLLAPKPPSTPPGFQTVKQAIPDRVRGWGRCRLYGAIMLDEAVGANLYRVWALHDGQVAAFERFYFNDDLVYTTNGQPGWVQAGVNNRYHPDHVWMEWRSGLTPETAYADLVGEQPDLWNASCRGDGIASIYMKCIAGKSNDNPGLFPSSKPDLSVVARLSLAYDWRLDSTQPGGNGPQRQDNPATWTFSRNPIVCWVNELWRFRGYDWDSRFAPTLALLTAEADICDEPVAVLNTYGELILKASQGDTSIVIDNANGLHAGMTLQLRPNAQYHETLTVESVAPWANGYIEGFTVGFTTPLGNNHALREPVTWISDPANPATEPRYAVDTFFESAKALSDVISAFRTACDGWMARNGSGAVILRTGHYYAPTISLGPEDIIDYEWSSYVEDSQAVNVLRPQFVFPAADYRTVETDAWEDEDDIEARGQERAQQLDLPSVTANSQARRLAKRKMAQLLAASGTLRCKLSAIRALGERYISVDVGPDEIEELQNVVLEIIDDPVIGDDGQSISFTVCVADPNVDAWNYVAEEGRGPIIAAASDIPELAPAVITSAEAVFEDNGTGGQGVRIQINGTGPDRDDLTWYAQTRVAGAAVWVSVVYQDLAGGASVQLETGFITANASVEVQIAYATGAGAMSDWSASVFVDTTTANLPPAPASGVTGVAGVQSATISWTNPTSANFSACSVWRSAHGAGFAGAAAVSGAISGALGAQQSFTANGLTTGTTYDFWVVSQNAAGVHAAAAGPAPVTAQ